MEDLRKQQGNPKLLSPLSLAFVGDAVYELLVRERIASVGSMPANKLHALAVKRVKAQAQAQAYRVLEPQLSEEELQILKRGRNASGSTKSRSADMAEYRRATGVECLFGYLYLCGRLDRINELFVLIEQSEGGETE